MAELTGAKISRGRLKGSAEKKIYLLKEAFSKLQNLDTSRVTLEQITELQATVETTREVLDKYTAAVDRCLNLEGNGLEPEGEHMVTLGELEDEFDNLNHKVQALKARVREEKSAKARAEANAQGRTQEQSVNGGRVVAKPPPALEKDITLDELETWSSTWEDYYSVTKLEKEALSIQRANLKSHLSQEMRGVVEHVLGIGQDSTKTCSEILKDIKAHIRSNRNIQIDKVAFEKRTQDRKSVV